MAVSAAALVTAVAFLIVQAGLSGVRRVAPAVLPLAAFLWAARSGLAGAVVAALSVRLFEQALVILARRQRLERLRDGAEDPIQAMFEQASLFGSAELCALAALPACGPGLRPIWQRALAEWLRGSASEEAFRATGRAEGIPLFVQLGRALSLARRSGTPLARHLAVLLEDAAEDRRRRHEAQGQTLPYFVVTTVLAGIVLGGALFVLSGSHAGVEHWIAEVAAGSAGGIPFATARLLP